MRWTPRRVTLFAIVATTFTVACETARLVDPDTGEPLWASVTPPTATLRAIGATLQLTIVNAAGAPVTVTGVTWRIIEPNIIDVDGSGLVTALGPGTARIVIETTTQADTVSVEVRQDVSAITVSPALPSIMVDATLQMSAELMDPNGHFIAGRAVTWSSQSEQVATVSGSGVVTGHGAGSAIIVAGSEGASGSTTVTVTTTPPPPPAPVATVTVAPASATVSIGATRQLTATLRDAGGNVLSGRTVTWQTNAGGVATVSTAGLVTAHDDGEATITATSEGQSGASVITVPAPAPDIEAPSTPLNVVAVAASATQVNVTWSASSDNFGVTGYRVFRNGSQVGTPSAPSFQDAGLSPSTPYSYTVRAVDAAGNVSSASAAAPATTPAAGAIGTALPTRLAQSTGTTFYVATTGSDANPGTVTSPWRTVQKAMSTLTAGQRAYVRGGTYAEDLTWTRAGTATAPITIEAYPGETPIIDSEFTGSGLEIGSSGAYLRIRGFIFERDCCTSGGHIDVYGHHIEIVDNELRDGHGKGVYTDEGSHHVHIIGNWIHHNVTVGGQQDHGIYLQGDDHLVANNVIHDHPDGFGIQAYDKGARYIIVNNTVTNNGHSGIVVGGSGGVSDVVIRNNILANNSRYGVQHDSSCPTANVVVEYNVIFGNGSGGVQTGCSAISASGNIASNPMFVNAGNTTTRDLRVQSGSPAIGAARVDFAMPATIDGGARDAQPDIGAYEYGVAATAQLRTFGWFAGVAPGDEAALGRRRLIGQFDQRRRRETAVAAVVN